MVYNLLGFSLDIFVRVNIYRTLEAAGLKTEEGEVKISFWIGRFCLETFWVDLYDKHSSPFVKRSSFITTSFPLTYPGEMISDDVSCKPPNIPHIFTRIIFSQNYILFTIFICLVCGLQFLCSGGVITNWSSFSISVLKCFCSKYISTISFYNL